MLLVRGNLFDISANIKKATGRIQNSINSSMGNHENAEVLHVKLCKNNKTLQP